MAVAEKVYELQIYLRWDFREKEIIISGVCLEYKARYTVFVHNLPDERIISFCPLILSFQPNLWNDRHMLSRDKDHGREKPITVSPALWAGTGCFQTGACPCFHGDQHPCAALSSHTRLPCSASQLTLLTCFLDPSYLFTKAEGKH